MFVMQDLRTHMACMRSCLNHPTAHTTVDTLCASSTERQLAVRHEALTTVQHLSLLLMAGMPGPVRLWPQPIPRTHSNREQAPDGNASATEASDDGPSSSSSGGSSGGSGGCGMLLLKPSWLRQLQLAAPHMPASLFLPLVHAALTQTSSARNRLWACRTAAPDAHGRGSKHAHLPRRLHLAPADTASVVARRAFDLVPAVATWLRFSPPLAVAAGAGALEATLQLDAMAAVARLLTTLKSDPAHDSAPRARLLMPLLLARLSLREPGSLPELIEAAQRSRERFELWHRHALYAAVPWRHLKGGVERSARQQWRDGLSMVQPAWHEQWHMAAAEACTDLQSAEALLDASADLGSAGRSLVGQHLLFDKV